MLCLSEIRIPDPLPEPTLSHVFPRHCQSSFPTAVAGDGCYLIDSNGKRYFDGSGGAAVSCLGHSNQAVKDAVTRQVESLAFAHTGFFTSEPAEQLADLLIEHAPGNLDRVYFVSGGSESVESALKLARQYFVERGEPQRNKLIARRQSYHGNTLGALAVGGNQWRRAQFDPLLVDVSHIAPCYEYAERHEKESVEDYGQRVAAELETEILRLGEDSVMAFLAEPVVGATLGAVPPVEGYFKRVREICDQYGVLLILDEVMCGMGRTGHLFAHEADNINADIVCIAKGLGAGYQPIGAMLCTSENRFGDHPHVGNIRGRGFFWGLEFVADRQTKAPLDPTLKLAASLKKSAFQEGLICYPMPGTRDGKYGDHVLLAPPFIATDEELDDAIERLATAVEKTL